MNGRAAEVLIHITAPSRAIDDVKYRNFARAYMAFEPCAMTSIITAEELTSHSQPATFISSQIAGEEAVIDSPDLSFQGAFGSMNSLRVPRATEREIQEEAQDSQSSWVAPPSVIQDSLPDNNYALPQYCSPTRILEHYISAFDSSQSTQSPLAQIQTYLESDRTTGSDGGHSPRDHNAAQEVVPREAVDDHGEREDTRLSTQQNSQPQTHTERLPDIEHGGLPPFSCRHTQAPTPSPIGTVIPLSPITGKPVPFYHSSASNSFVEETRIASSFPSEAIVPSSRAVSEPPAKRHHRSPPPQGKALGRSSSDIGPRQEPLRVPEASDALDQLEIVAPSPPTSDRELCPSDMITETLTDLAERVNLQSRYRPQSQTRELRPFERGYWLIDCSSWESALKESAWELLADYLRNGLVGWGTRCTRDKQFTWIRLYCWGCVVEYMYLVIWVASKRRVRFTGASWVGAEGKPVVVIGARPPSR